MAEQQALECFVCLCLISTNLLSGLHCYRMGYNSIEWRAFAGILAIGYIRQDRLFTGPVQESIADLLFH